jgi:hypothetical protein
MGKPFISLAILALAGLAMASAAPAETVCGRASPVVGAVVHGPILDIPNSATLCIATGASPSQWVAIPVPQLRASRALLMAAAFGQNATCVVGADGLGDCRIEGRALADEVTRAEVRKASMQWRDRREAPNPSIRLAFAAR